MSRSRVSVTLDDDALAWLRQRANRVHGGNLSAAVAEATELARKSEGLRALLDADGVPRLTQAELAELTSEWRAAPRRARCRAEKG